MVSLAPRRRFVVALCPSQKLVVAVVVVLLGSCEVAAILAVKAYVEMYEGKMRKQTVNYKNFRQSTHAIMLLFTIATVAFYVALWPAYGWKSVLIMCAVGYGILLQFALLVPTYVQNIVGFVLMTFFLQEYA